MSEKQRLFIGPQDDAVIILAPTSARHYVQFGESRLELRIDSENGGVSLEPADECSAGFLRIVGQDASGIGRGPYAGGSPTTGYR